MIASTERDRLSKAEDAILRSLLAAITCVFDDAPGEASSGVLCLYPSRTSETLGAIRADDGGGVHIRLAPGQSLVLLGGVIPHRLLPMKPGHTRIVAPLCYQAAG